MVLTPVDVMNLWAPWMSVWSIAGNMTMTAIDVINDTCNRTMPNRITTIVVANMNHGHYDDSVGMDDLSM